MKYFVSFCLAAAVVIGAATAPVFGCGGMGQTGCKLASMPLTFEAVVSVIRWLGLVIP